MSSEALENLFQPFYTTKSGGTGLGLAVTQKIILDHGGDIAVESELERGTTFDLFFPVEKRKRYRPEADAETGPGTELRPDFSREGQQPAVDLVDR